MIWHNVSWLDGEGSWRWLGFDKINTMIQFVIVRLLICSKRRWENILATGYLAYCAAVLFEYQQSEDGLRVLANHIYWCRAWFSVVLDLTFSGILFVTAISRQEFQMNEELKKDEELEPVKDAEVEEDDLDEEDEEETEDDDDGDDDPDGGGDGVPTQNPDGPH